MTKHNGLLLGITGCIAAYKMIEFVRLFRKAHITSSCKVVLTRAAENFVTPLAVSSVTSGTVYTDDMLFIQQNPMIHIMLAKFAQIILVAPASANFISKLAHGIADCLLSTVCLASYAKIAIAPSMNQQMWHNKVLQANIDKLISHGVEIFGPDYGVQACGDIGLGRMMEPALLLDSVTRHFTPQLLAGKTVCVTAGPTREKIDPMRCITNCSSGKMGYALAEAAKNMGANVVLISGIVSIPVPYGVDIISVESTAEMNAAAQRVAAKSDIFISAAAISDYAPVSYSQHKLKKINNHLTITLQPTADVISSIKDKYSDVFVVGFAAETENMLINAQDKLNKKGIDMVVANDISDGKVIGLDDATVCIISKKGDEVDGPINGTKKEIAYHILKRIAYSISR